VKHPRFSGYDVLEIAQNPETGVVWVKACLSDRRAYEIIVTADSFFIPPIARQIIRLFPPPSDGAQSVRLQNELGGSLRVIDGGRK